MTRFPSVIPVSLAKTLTTSIAEWVRIQGIRLPLRSNMRTNQQSYETGGAIANKICYIVQVVIWKKLLGCPCASQIHQTPKGKLSVG